MGFLDKAKKIAEQAKDKAEEALAEAKARSGSRSGGGGSGAPSTTDIGEADPRMGTRYVPGMLGRPGWRERGFVDPAALLPIADRDRAGIPHSTKSEIVQEPFGVGRRWSSGGRAAGLFYQLDPEHVSWDPPGGSAPMGEVAGASAASLPDGRSLVFLGDANRRVVLEMKCLEDARTDLARSVAAQLASA